MKKVLFIITRLAAGGAPSITLAMLKFLSENGYDVELVTGLADKNERDLLPDIQKSEITVTVIPELVRDIHPLKDFIALGKLRKLIKAKNFDLVHTHTTKAGILGRLAAKQAKVTHVIHSPHGHIFHGYINPILTKLYIYLERVAAKWSQKTITLTEKETKEYLEFGIGAPDEYQCIYNGIDAKRFYDENLDIEAYRKKLEIPESAIVISIVGRLVPVKGHKYLLEALAILNKQNSYNIHCLIIGDGVLMADLENQTHKLGLSGKITFLGQQENITPFLMISDLFVLPSLNEGFGLVIAEAMAAGLPIVATRVGGVPEIVIDGETGKLVKPASGEDLANGISELIKDRQQLKRIGEQNRIRAQKDFSLEQMNAKVKKLYEDVFAQP